MNCRNCGLGRVQKITIPYIMPFGNRVLVLNHAPARSCDTCGETGYDERFLKEFATLIQQHMTPPKYKTTARPRPMSVKAFRK